MGAYMSLAKRIIPTILMKNGLLVKGKQFSADRVVGNALQAAKIHAMRGVDEILILDVTATREGREPDYAMIEKLTSTTTVPVTVGGGIQSVEHVRNLLASGADKVCIGSALGMVEPLADKFGSQCIVAALDINQERPEIGAWVAEYEGAGEILLQSIPRDGTMRGYDLDLIKLISDWAKVPVVASGGCSGYPDMLAAITAGASAVAAGALFQFTDATPKGAAEYLNSQGVEVRL
jgi:cyclase